MTNSQRLATVRARLLRWLAEEQGGAETPRENEKVILRESILIRGEFYCGRRFHTATHDAVWFIEENELKIYSSDGTLACVLAGDELTSMPPQAEPQAEDPQPVEVRALIKLPTPTVEQDDQDDQIRRAA